MRSRRAYLPFFAVSFAVLGLAVHGFGQVTNRTDRLADGNDTNGLRAILDASDGPNGEIFVGVVSVGPQVRYRWVRPTNEIPCRIWLWNEKGALQAPINKNIESASYIPERWASEAFPFKRSRTVPHKYFSGSFLCFLDLKRYYDLSRGGNFTLKVSPMLYDAKQETNVLHLVELPPATYKFSLPNQSSNQTVNSVK